MAGSHHISRRDFIKLATFGAGGIIGAAVGIPGVIYLVDPALGKAGEDAWVSLGPLANFPVGGTPTLVTFVRSKENGWEKTSNSYGVFVIRKSEEEVLVLSNVCTHLVLPGELEGRQAGLYLPLPRCRLLAGGRSARRTSAATARQLRRRNRQSGRRHPLDPLHGRLAAMKNLWKKFFDWLDERLGLNDLYKATLDRPEPKGNWWNTLGSASLFLFVMQGLTGIFLTVYYTPSPDHAYDSIQYIMNGVQFGWLIRGIHHWGASLMVIVVFIHMLRVFTTASYKYPRELTWLIGVGLLLLTLGMGFTGYLLPWNQKAFWATTVGTAIAGSVPWVGEFILEALRGGSDLSALTLSRFFSAHIWILPALLVALIGVHIFLIVKHGESAFPDKED